MRSPLLSPLHRCIDLMLACDLVEALEKAMAPLTARLQEKGWAVTPQKGLSVQFLAVFGRLRRRSHQRRRDSSIPGSYSTTPPCGVGHPPPRSVVGPGAVWHITPQGIGPRGHRAVRELMMDHPMAAPQTAGLRATRAAAKAWGCPSPYPAPSRHVRLWCLLENEALLGAAAHPYGGPHPRSDGSRVMWVPSLIRGGRKDPCVSTQPPLCQRQTRPVLWRHCYADSVTWGSSALRSGHLHRMVVPSAMQSNGSQPTGKV